MQLPPLSAQQPIRWEMSVITVSFIVALASIALSNGLTNFEDNMVALFAQQGGQPAAVKASKRQNGMVNAVPREENRIIVKYKERDLPPGLEIAAERANLEKAQGLTKLFTIDGVGAEVYEVSEDDTASESVQRLLSEKKDLIEYAEVDMLVPPTYMPNDPSYGSQWHLTKIAAPAAWDSTKGAGIVVGVADSGVDCTHADLAANCVAGWNVVSGNADTSDVNGHGTAVAGTVAEVGDNGVGSAGVAYNAKIMPLRISNSADGYAYFSDVARAITWGADNGARIVTNSYASTFSTAVQSSADYLRSKGGVFVAAAGNDSTELTGSNPASIITTSATLSDDTKAGWSNFGVSIDISAPGNYIYATSRGGGYGNRYGTSFSTPVTAGVLALILTANPELTPTEAENVLFVSSDDLGTAGWDKLYGFGRVNAAKAVAQALAVKGTLDTQKPTTPTNLTTTGVTSNSASLSWYPATDNLGVTGYNVYRNGSKVATVAGTSYVNASLSSETSYAYAVSAIDKASNESDKTAEVSATTAALPFGISLYSVPTKTSTGATVAVTLTKPGTVTVKYGTSASNLNLTAQGGAAATTHSVSITGLTAFTTYYYQVVATDASGAVVSSGVSSFKTAKSGGGGKPRR